MTHFLQDPQVLLDQGPPSSVGRKARQHGLTGMRKSQKRKDRNREKYRNDDWRQSPPGAPQHQGRIETDRTMSPDDHHHQKLLQREERRVSPVNGEDEPVVGAEPSHQIARHLTPDDMIDEQRRRRET